MESLALQRRINGVAFRPAAYRNLCSELRDEKIAISILAFERAYMPSLLM